MVINSLCSYVLLLEGKKYRLAIVISKKRKNLQKAVQTGSGKAAKKVTLKRKKQNRKIIIIILKMLWLSGPAIFTDFFHFIKKIVVLLKSEKCSGKLGQ